MTPEELQNNIGKECAKAVEGGLTPADVLLALNVTTTQALVMATLDVITPMLDGLKKQIEELKAQVKELKHNGN